MELEKMKAVTNPLTIIAIFAVISEVSMTAALGFVSGDLQGTFIWFVMGFPVLLVVLFFITLNFNNRVLYAPSDYRDDAAFMEMQNASGKLDRAKQQLEAAPDKIVTAAIEQFKDVSDDERRQLSSAVRTAMQEIVDNVTDATDEVRKASKALSEMQDPNVHLYQYAPRHTVGPLAATPDAVKSKYK